MKKKADVRKISKSYLEELLLKDFLGKLSDFEIEIAKENGLLTWDLWVKAKELRLQYEHSESFKLAPVLNGYGKIDMQRYPKNVRFLIQNYEELAKKTANK